MGRPSFDSENRSFPVDPANHTISNDLCAVIDAMKQATTQEAVNEYTGKGRWSGLGAGLVLMVMWLLRPSGLAYRVLVRFSGLLGEAKAVLKSGRRNRYPASESSQCDIQPRLVLARDEVMGSLNLAVTNRSRLGVWAEAAKVDLAHLDADGETSAPTGQAILEIREFVGPTETLHVSLVEAVYDAAGRPQGVYSCRVSTVLRYRAHNDEEEFEVPLPLYRVSMIALVPISLRRMRWFDKPARPRKADGLPPLQRREQPNRARRSQRVIAQSAVIVKGKFSDGSPFLDSTRALVLSAHGCLVTLATPVRIGESLVVRNVRTLHEQPCQVVYIGKKYGGRTEVGLGFESAAPEFWGIDRLPSDWKAALQ